MATTLGVIVDEYLGNVIVTRFAGPRGAGPCYQLTTDVGQHISMTSNGLSKLAGMVNEDLGKRPNNGS